jgi:hypothetical protein
VRMGGGWNWLRVVSSGRFFRRFQKWHIARHSHDFSLHDDYTRQSYAYNSDLRSLFVISIDMEYKLRIFWTFNGTKKKYARTVMVFSQGILILFHRLWKISKSPLETVELK